MIQLFVDILSMLIVAGIIAAVLVDYIRRILRRYRVLYLVKTPVGCVIVGSSRFRRLTKADQVQDHWAI